MFANRDNSKAKVNPVQRKSSITLNGSVPLFDPEKQKNKKPIDKSSSKQRLSIFDMVSEASHAQTRKPNDLTKRMLYEKKEAEQKYQKQIKQLKKQLSQLQQKYDKQTAQYNKLKENYRNANNFSKIHRENSCIRVNDVPMAEQQIIEDMNLLNIPKIPLDNVKLGRSFDYVQLDIPLENFMQTPRVERKQSEQPKQLLNLPIDWLSSQPASPIPASRSRSREKDQVKELKSQIESLKAQLEKYKKNQYEFDKLQRMRGQLNQAKKIMMKEYDKLLQIKEIVKDIEMPVIGKPQQNGQRRSQEHHHKEQQRKQENGHKKLKEKKVSFEHR